MNVLSGGGERNRFLAKCTLVHYTGTTTAAQLTLFSFAGMATAGRDQLRLVVSGYSNQLRTFTVDQSGHVLEGGQQDWTMDTNPTWLQIVDKSIYALHEVGCIWSCWPVSQ